MTQGFEGGSGQRQDSVEAGAAGGGRVGLGGGRTKGGHHLGSFTMGDCMQDDYSDELPTHGVNVSAFYMDTNLIVV
jgi:hypothetical protein